MITKIMATSMGLPPVDGSATKLFVLNMMDIVPINHGRLPPLKGHVRRVMKDLRRLERLERRELRLLRRKEILTDCVYGCNGYRGKYRRHTDGPTVRDIHSNLDRCATTDHGVVISAADAVWAKLYRDVLSYIKKRYPGCFPGVRWKMWSPLYLLDFRHICSDYYDVYNNGLSSRADASRSPRLALDMRPYRWCLIGNNTLIRAPTEEFSRFLTDIGVMGRVSRCVVCPTGEVPEDKWMET